jgi:cell division protein FtsW
MGTESPLNKGFLRSSSRLSSSKAGSLIGQPAQPSTARERRAARRGQSSSSGRTTKENGLPPDLNVPGEVTPAFSAKTTAKPSIVPHRPISLGFDVPLLLVVCTLVLVGMVMLFSASWKYSLWQYDSPYSIFTRQLAWLGLALVAGIVASLLDYHHWRILVIPMMVTTIILLILVLFVQDERHGAVRSLLSGSIQPSELAKLTIVLYVSVWLYNHRENLRNVALGLLPLGTIIGVTAALIALQPDLSAVLTVIILGGILFFLAGGDLRQIFVLMMIGAAAGWAVLESGVFTTGKDRVDSFWAGLLNPLDASDHVQRSIEAFVRGGWFGVGIGKASSKLTALPFPHTDSIFAVIGEETGVIGAALMVVLYGLLMWRGLVIARRSPDTLGALMAGGLAFWITMEAIVNMAVMVGLMPFAGNALPFVSAGGSNRVVSLIAIGILLNVSRLSEKNKEEERTFNAFVDLRRRDWRGSVSRSRRT